MYKYNQAATKRYPCSRLIVVCVWCLEWYYMNSIFINMTLGLELK